MSFLLEKRKEHLKNLETCCQTKENGKGIFHGIKVAEFSIKLAEKSQNVVGRKYIKDANDYLDVVEKLMKNKKTTSSDTNKDKKYGDIKLDDIAGLQEVKQDIINKIVKPFKYKELYKNYNMPVGGGILMYGPPGNGKTMLAKAIANEVDAKFFNINFSQIKNKYYGESEKNLQSVFDEAAKNDTSIIFIDEIDYLFSNETDNKVGLSAQFLALSDGMLKSDKCMILIAATNKPWNIDASILRNGRLGTHIYVGTPDEEARKFLFINNMVQSVSLNVPLCVDMTNGYSGSDIVEICNRIKQYIIDECIGGNVISCVQDDKIKDIILGVVPVVSSEMEEKYRNWRKNNEK
ncbi:MAG: ATP-binding protein [Candidatus Omnitrophica bacterium]|nr:ATP-binding protein [Candidatus Omnitrophota bacterium]